jgi:hypothetical protein
MGARERFVPQRVGQILATFDEQPWHAPGAAARFRLLARMVSALIHFETHERERAMTQAWHTVDGAGPGIPVDTADVTTELVGLLEAGNFVPVTIDELDRAMEAESLVPLRLEVDLDDYDDLIIHRRGSHTETIEVKRWKGLRTDERRITIDEQVVVLTRTKPRAWFDERGVDPDERGLVPGLLSLKLFQDVPRADIEMLLPSTEVRFRPIDTILVGVPAVASGVIVLATKLGPTIALIALLIGAWLGLREETPELDQTALVVLLGGAVTLGGFLFRQWNKLKNRRVAYLKTLSENLYFRTLADGPGVIHTLLAAAEEQEVIEVLLAYRLLLAADGGSTDGGLTLEQLDRRVEEWLASTCQVQIDFEIDDAVAKLDRLDLLASHRPLRAAPLADALASLDNRWDDLFRPDGRPAPST